MNYKLNENEMQLSLNTFDKFLMIPSFLEGFTNTSTILGTTVKSNRQVYCFEGELESSDVTCPVCRNKMHSHSKKNPILRHLPFGSFLTTILFYQRQYYCENCHHSKIQSIPFKNPNHRITQELYNYVTSLLSQECYTLKEIAGVTGLNDDVVKDIDLERLKELYTEEGKQLKIPNQAKFLGIDEFKLHGSYKYATHIINLETGEVLYVAKGKKKQVVYDFIELVGEVHKDEQRHLKEEVNEEAAKALKGSRYILTSNRTTLQRKDLI